MIFKYRIWKQNNNNQSSPISSPPHNNISTIITTSSRINYNSRGCNTYNCITIKMLPLPSRYLNSCAVRVTSTSRTSYNKSILPTRGVNISNLITVNIQTTIYNDDTSIHMRIATVNTQSIRNKISDFLEYIINYQLDICTVTETWLGSIDVSLKRELNSAGYTFKDYDRTVGRGGGIGLVYKQGLNIVDISSGCKQSFEFSTHTITNRNVSILLVTIYRLQYSNTNPITFLTFREEFEEFLSNICLTHPNMILTGDFNIHVNDNDNNDNKHFKSMLQRYGFVQHVNVPTHLSGNTLDLIITREHQDLKCIHISTGYYISDHCFVHAHVTTPRASLVVKTIKYRKLKEIDMDTFRSELKHLIDTTLPETSDVNNLTGLYDTILTNMINKHAPWKERKITIRPKIPWYSKALREKKCVLRQQERIWKQSKLQSDYNNFKKCRNEYRRQLEHQKTEYYSNKIHESKGNSKSLFKIVTGLISSSKDNTMPEGSSKELCEEFADFYQDKIIRLRTDMEGSDIYAPSNACTSSMNDYRAITECEVKKIVMKMNTKSCELDPVPTDMVKKLLDVLLPLITKQLNASLASGVFPEKWKTSIVRPLLKKPKLERIYKNYRPVSNMSFMSKVNEKAALNQIIEYIEKNKLLPDYQSAYRENYSCETALIKVHHDILVNMDMQLISSLCAIDLSAAFDTVDHDILLDVMETDFGIKDTALKWIETYLRPRSMRVNVGEAYSTPKSLHFSVPQGSCAGPVLYTAYASTMREVVKRFNINIMGYADDHAIYNSFKPTRTCEQECNNNMQHCLKEIKVWMTSNRLHMNEDKTEFICFGSRHQLSKCREDYVTVGGKIVKKSDSIKYLGVWLDSTLSMRKQIHVKCRTALLNIYNIRKIRKYLTDDACKTIVQALVISHLDFCNELYIGLPEKDIACLQRVQNFAAKTILKRAKYDSATESLYKLHWLPISKRIEYKIIITVFKCLQGCAPEYLSNMINVKQNYNYNLRSSLSINLSVPRYKYKTFGQRSFGYQGPKLWNTLTPELREIKSLTIFKKQLKTFLFKKAFY